MKNDQTPPQGALLLRLLGGGYLVYLAYGIITDYQGKVIYLAAAAVFGLVGAALFLHTLLTLIRSGYFYNTPEDSQSSEEE